MPEGAKHLRISKENMREEEFSCPGRIFFTEKKILQLYAYKRLAKPFIVGYYQGKALIIVGSLRGKAPQ